MKSVWRLFCVALLVNLILCSTALCGRAAEIVKPESVGLSSKQLANIERLIDQYMAEKTIPGAVVLVARHGKIAYFKSFGKANEEQGLKRDAIFRLMSLSKPIVGATGILQLMEKGRLLLSDPVSRYIPEFKNQKVAKFDLKARMTLVPAKREITIHDLLTFTSGISTMWNNLPLDKMYREAGLSFSFEQSLEERVKIVAGLPLAHHPGEAWTYANLQSDILGYIVEVVSGMRFDRYMEEYLFKPLGMTDTHFYPPKTEWQRVTGLYYALNGKNGKKGDLLINESKSFVDNLPNYSFIKAPVYFTPAGGLHSTAYDVFRYFEMLLNHGESDGVRVLSRHAVKLMTQNQIGNLREYQYGHGWGYSVGVQAEDAPAPIIGKNYGGTGAFSWDGYTGPVCFANPVNDTVIVLMTHVWTVEATWGLQARVVNVVNRAIGN